MSQLEMTFTPREQGEQAAQACLGAAERRGFDTEGARNFIVGWLRRWGPQSGESLVRAANEHGYRPANGNRAFGAVFNTLHKRKQITCLRSDLPRECGHGTSGGKLWAATA